MTARIDLTGQHFGHLTVIGRAGTKSRNTIWLCQCECGRTKAFPGNNLRRNAKSCGCRRHHLSTSPEYRAWASMRHRCSNPNSDVYGRYGGRGIKVCERWQKFENFYSDMGPRPTPKHSLERVDNDGIYEPGNCVWATNQEQSKNRRSTVLLTFLGRTQCKRDWAEEFGLSPGTLSTRLAAGWSIGRALTAPVRGRHARSGEG